LVAVVERLKCRHASSRAAGTVSKQQSDSKLTVFQTTVLGPLIEGVIQPRAALAFDPHRDEPEILPSSTHPFCLTIPDGKHRTSLAP
jgi:hypothetical protein